MSSGDGCLIQEDDYELEYSEDSASEPDVELENQYYHSKSIKDEDTNLVLSSFERVLNLQCDNKGKWGFKALKQIVKINFQLKNYEESINRYKDLLTYIEHYVTKNHSEKTINSILDYISSSNDIDVLKEFYEITLDTLKDARNDRLWFKTKTKLGRVYLERNELLTLNNVIKELYQHCNPDEEMCAVNGNQLLEIYALEIQMYTKQKNYSLLQDLYNRSLKVRSAVPHPITMSIIRECGGKMHLKSGEFEKAYTDFFEAFIEYDESGSPRRTTTLKYLILTSMLMKSSINPFDSQEAKPYKFNSEIRAMTDLITAYQNVDIQEFERIFKENKTSLLEDPFVREHVEELLKNIRTEVLLQLIKPYSTVRISFISQKLNIPDSETESLIVSCILNGSIQGRIDQINQILVRNGVKYIPKCKRYQAVQKLASSINSLNEMLTSSIRCDSV